MVDSFGQQVEEQAKLVISSGLGGAKTEIARMCNHLATEVKSETHEFKKDMNRMWKMREAVLQDTNTARHLSSIGVVANWVAATVVTMMFMTFVQVSWYHWLGLFMTIGVTGWIAYGLTKPATYEVSPHIVLKEAKPKPKSKPKSPPVKK